MGVRRLLLCATALASSAATLGVLLVGLAPASAPETPVSFETLTADVQAGQVTQISIHGRDYTYRRAHGPPGAPQPRATGPEPTLAGVRALCVRASGRCPRIVFEP